MKNLDVNYFKSELSNYAYYVSKIKRVKELQLVLSTKRGVHAIRYDKEVVQGSPDPLLNSLRKLDDSEMSFYLDESLKYFKTKLGYIDYFLNNSEFGSSIRKIHCLGTSTYETEAAKHFVSAKTLKRIVNKEIVSYIDK